MLFKPLPIWDKSLNKYLASKKALERLVETTKGLESLSSECGHFVQHSPKGKQEFVGTLPTMAAM